MQYADLVRLYFERSASLQGYWTLYVVIIGGLLAFSSLRHIPDKVTGILVTALFLFFAYKNLGAIHDVTLQRQATLEAIKATASPADAAGSASLSEIRAKLEPTLVSPDWEGTQYFHITCDAITVLALWAMELRRMRHAKKIAATA
ncbi:MAG TPA: hypothetical protein VGN88_07095 [Phycisphaerae bacterium]|jgi:hypothetical protein